MKISILLHKITKHICYHYHGIILFRKLSKNEKEIFHNMRVYNHLKIKYSSFIDNHKIEKKDRKKSNIIWWCWLQGEENAPKICKANLASLKDNIKDKEVIVIDEKNVYKYIELPEYIIDKYKKGIISKAHYCDLVRLQLLIKYGGTWIDSSVYCSGYNKVTKELLNSSLFVFEHWNRGDDSIVASNWFISADSNSQILTLTRDLLFEYWKKHNWLIHYYIFHLFFTIATSIYKEEWKQVHKFSNIPPHMLQREMLNKYDKDRFTELKYMSDFHKLTQKIDAYSNDSYYGKIIENYEKGNTI